MHGDPAGVQKESSSSRTTENSGDPRRGCSPRRARRDHSPNLFSVGTGAGWWCGAFAAGGSSTESSSSASVDWADSESISGQLEDGPRESAGVDADASTVAGDERTAR